MATIFQYLDKSRVQVISPNGVWVCCASEVNKQHHGTWNDLVLCFIPPPPTQELFSDGIPAAHYDESYSGDHSGTFYDDCVICGEPTNGSRYCGPSCELYDITNGEMEFDA